jgi:uncharacterized protein (TIGR03437 family)
MLSAASSAVFAQTPAVSPGGILNAASNDKTGQPLAPGSLVSIYGTSLVGATGSAGLIPLPPTLSGTSVTFNGVSAPMLSTFHGPSYDQLNVQIPWEAVALQPPTSNGTIKVVVTNNNVVSSAYTQAMTTASPGIFTTGSGPGQAIAYGNSDGILAGPASAVSHPIKIGTALDILATGLGAVDHAVASGGVPAAGVLAQTVTTPVVLIGGVPAQVLFSGLTSQFVGVYQINVIVAPGTPTGDNIPLQMQMNGITTRNDATISVSQ